MLLCNIIEWNSAFSVIIIFLLLRRETFIVLRLCIWKKGTEKEMSFSAKMLFYTRKLFLILLSEGNRLSCDCASSWLPACWIIKAYYSVKRFNWLITPRDSDPQLHFLWIFLDNQYSNKILFANRMRVTNLWLQLILRLNI